MLSSSPANCRLTHVSAYATARSLCLRVVEWTCSFAEYIHFIGGISFAHVGFRTFRSRTNHHWPTSACITSLVCTMSYCKGCHYFNPIPLTTGAVVAFSRIATSKTCSIYRHFRPACRNHIPLLGDSYVLHTYAIITTKKTPPYRAATQLPIKKSHSKIILQTMSIRVEAECASVNSATPHSVALHNANGFSQPSNNHYIAHRA